MNTHTHDSVPADALPVAQPAAHLALAERIRSRGARVTPARLAVLRLLDGATQALTHHDIEAQLVGSGFDRVTLYRVLEWLVDNGLAHRVTDSQRVFRFSAANDAAPAHGEHAHFRCEVCARVFCLDDLPTDALKLPAGFHGRSVEFSVTGECAQCSAAEHGEAAQ